MLHAQLHGKLSREQENLEDILTSNVFGTLSYLPAGDGIMKLLSRCEGEAGALRRALEELSLSDTQAEFVFWPWLEAAGCNGCEPDVLIRLTGMGDLRVLILIEAKYRSGKSSVAADIDETTNRPNDQLAREWDNLSALAASERARAFLVYVTADYVMPRAEIEESQAELLARRGSRGQIAWLPWRVFGLLSFRGSRIANDVVRLLRERYGLSFFTGVKVATASCPWTFSAPTPGRPYVATGWASMLLPWGFESVSTASTRDEQFIWTFMEECPWKWSQR